jgi:hypothetical protein
VGFRVVKEALPEEDSMPTPRHLLALLLAFGLALPPVAAEEETAAEPGDTVLWVRDLPKAFARAKETDQILMICVNAKFVMGNKREEPAAKGLREVVYKDIRVVGKSRQFVCAFITPEGNSADYGELRALGIEGRIVSPQHIFVSPDGTRILERLEYWSYGQGDTAVKELLAMMERAQAKLKSAAETPLPEAPDAGGTDDPQPSLIAPDAQHAKERTDWIQRMLEHVRTADETRRREALSSLVSNDKDGDCIDPLIAMLPEQEKNVPVLTDMIRALGRNELLKAADPIAEHLGHKDDLVRGNAAVSLEYIGSSEKGVLGELKKRAAKEKNEQIANHLYRALGRCGAGDAKVRALLLKKAEGAKSEFASFGPIIGLAYFDGDKKAMRAVEKMLKKIGPGGGRGGWRNSIKRGFLCWTLASIGDEKSAEFIREDMLPQIENMRGRWAGPLQDFYGAVATACDGDDEALGRVEEGVARIISFARGGWNGNGGGNNGGRGGGPAPDDEESPELQDECRRGRDTTTFEPKGDSISGGGGE